METELLDNLPDAIQMDIQALLQPPQILETDESLIKNTLVHLDSLLVNISLFVYEKGRYVALKEEEKGLFYLGDAYIFLCIYNVYEENLPGEEVEQSVESDSKLEKVQQEPSTKHECVIYFWKGRKAPRRGKLLFFFIT